MQEYDDYLNQIITGDALEVLKTLPDNYVQCCVTSPPYFGLRDYQTEQIWTLKGDPECEHVWIHEGRNEDGHKVAQCQYCSAAKVDQQIGLEETPEAYIDRLVKVFREVRRVLRKDGTCWINIGDSYVGYKGEHYNQNQRRGTGEYSPVPASHNIGTPHTTPGLKNKDLIGIPWMLAFALRADGWYLRADIIWSKPNCMPESVTDRPTKSHEYIFLLAKSRDYYYDADSIREPLKPKTFTTYGTKHRPQGNDALGLVKSDNWGSTVSERQPKLAADGSIAGANKRSIWTVASQPYPESHFATFPPKLIEPCILAGSSPRACEHCNAPWERISIPTGHVNKREPAHALYSTPTKVDSTGWSPTHMGTDQWQPTCTCSNNTGTGKCLVLDCFMGAGTTALVALQHGRDYLGIELNPEYVTLIQKRIKAVQQNLWTVEAGGVA